MRDVLLTGKVKEATTRTDSGRRVYDAVVLDRHDHQVPGRTHAEARYDLHVVVRHVLQQNGPARQRSLADEAFSTLEIL